MADKKKSTWWDNVKVIVYAVALAIVIRTVAFEPFNIPSGSMKPTLLIGDYLFVSKFSYGYSRHSMPFSLPLVPGRVLFSEPQRGDVAVFKLPKDGKTDFIKRIIGLPGDRIQVVGGVLHINGEAVQRRRIDDFVDQDGFGRLKRSTRYVETLPNGIEHEILEQSDNGQYDNTRIYTVPPGHYFAMGDNRDNSQDSRVLNEVGFIPRENLVGRAEILFFSHNSRARFWEIWKWPIAIRFSRFFNGIG